MAGGLIDEAADEFLDLERRQAGMHGDRYVGVLDAVTHAVLGRIEGLGGNLEQPRYYPGDGMVYVASRTANALHQIDPTTDTLVRTFEIGVPCNPNGVAINPKTGQALLVSDNNQITVVWDLKEQKIASVIEESGAGGGAFYDPTIDRFFAAHSGFADGPVIGMFGGDPVRFLTNVPTQRGASWVAYDRTNGLVYAQAIQAGTPAQISFPLAEVMVIVTERRIVRRFPALKPVFAKRPLRLTAPAGLHGARRTASRRPGVMTAVAARSATQ